jgi:RNA polymerase sigma-32 factor
MNASKSRNRPMAHRADDLGRHLLAGKGSKPLGAALQSQVALAYRQTRDPRLERKLVEANLRLVVTIAREHDRSRGRNLEDLVQEGCLGLIEAIRRFDPTKGAQLSTYARFWIRAFIMRHIMDNIRVVRAVRTRAERMAFFKGVVAVTDVSFDSTAGPNGAPLQDLLADPASSAETVLEAAELVREIRQRVADLEGRLRPRDAVILRERLLADEPSPRSEVGKRLSLSGERVRQIEGTLRAAIRGGGAEGFAAGRAVAA